MKKILLCGLFLLPLPLMAQDLEKEPIILDSVIVAGNKASDRTPVSHTNISKEVILKSAPNSSIPLLLNLQPSVVATAEAGSGLGYTRLSVRGSDATRTNVTLNGVTINDAESQEVFWVNIPAITSFLESVQLQRGIGTSTNGPGAFGASINMQTWFATPEPYGKAEIAYGSYKTAIASFGAGTGLLPSGLSFDFHFSNNATEGYIRNGGGRLNSLYSSIGYHRGSNSFKINYILGNQHTGITWEGISREMLEKDRRSNPAGLYYDEAGNEQYYDNETDNYTQHYFQGFYSHSFSSELLWVNTLNFTKGDGYYENYEYDQKFSKYGLLPQAINGQEHHRSDFIVRQAMDNGYYVASSTLKYHSTALRVSGGVAYSLYDGLYFGNMLWSKYDHDISESYRWYDNRGVKWEMNTFLRGEWDVASFTFYADMQYRYIDWNISGIDDDFVGVGYQRQWGFFNPKAGLTYSINENQSIYGSFAYGHKEPSRSDIMEAIKSGRGDGIKPESMCDIEVGYRYASSKFAFGANLYFMEYKDQLVATGKLTDVGYEIKENVPESFRRGVEVTAGWQIQKWLRADGNITLSSNKILDYTAWVDTYDNPSDWNSLGQKPEYHENTTLTMSPSAVGMAMLTIEPLSGLRFAANGKYVGKQFYDNTACDQRSIPGYFVMGADASYKIRLCKKYHGLSPAMTFSLFVDNLLDNEYVSNAWVYRANFADGSAPYLQEGFFPQANRNFMLKVTFDF